MTDKAYQVSMEFQPGVRRRLVLVSSDKAFAESLRSHLAVEFDVLMARNAGEAAAKAQAVSSHMVIVDLGAPVLGMAALGRLKSLSPSPIVCSLVVPGASTTESGFEFDYVLARPTSGADMPERIRFILAKAKGESNIA